MPRDADQRSVRLAALRTGWQVAAVSTVLVIGVLVLASLFVVGQSRPRELLERPEPGETRIYIDSAKVLFALALVGVGAVAVVGLASWVIAGRAVTPLGSALRIQRSFVADASHELRTPLTVLDMRLQVLARRLEAGEPGGTTLAEAQDDVRVMIDLITDLLLVAEESAGDARGAVRADCDLAAAVTSSAAAMRVLAAARGISIDCEVASGTTVAMAETGLRRALTVLIDNAVAHSEDGSAVFVTAWTQRGRAVVRVGDEGGGIRGIEPARVFDRFAHGEPSDRRRGFGLGLALVRDLVGSHGGRVSVESTGPAGTVMRLELPILRRRSSGASHIRGSGAQDPLM